MRKSLEFLLLQVFAGFRCSMDFGFKNHAPAVFPTATPEPCRHTNSKGIMSLPQTRAFWPRRSDRRWLAHEIGQQPVIIFLPKPANVLEMPYFIGYLQFFAF
jgi:hypothetical protein